ncbi:hypothetical protein GF337_01190 [candidate division KSB1 bacterium]|nr:hypothetical protein [candidate division KSB1 bacterium]
MKKKHFHFTQICHGVRIEETVLPNEDLIEPETLRARVFMTIASVRSYRCILFILIYNAFFTTGIPAQSLRPQYYNPDDERYKFLALKKAELYLNESKSGYERAKSLFEKGLISEEKYEKIKVEYQHAEVTYQQALLNIIFDKPHITIEKAIKYQTKEGKKRVKLTLHNTGGGSFDLEKLKTLEMKSVAAELNPRELVDVYVSLLKDETIIGQPYEVNIPVFSFGERRIVDFALLQDLDEVIVSINFADKIDSKKIMLEKDASMNIVTMNSIQFSQEADLGNKATFDLILERFTSDNNIFKLDVINLPREIIHEFTDPETGARLSQVKFTEGVTNRNLSLTLYLPETTTDEIQIDKPLSFFALVMDEFAQKELRSLEYKNERNIDKINAGKVKLELIPRGVGKIVLKTVNLYFEIRPDEIVSMKVVVRNEGTRRLDNIRIKTDNPLNWISEIEPDLIDSLPPDKEKMVALKFIPPENVTVGDYEVKIRTESISNMRMVESEEKIVRIHIISAANIWGSIFLALLLIGMIVGIVVFGIRISRR